MRGWRRAGVERLFDCRVFGLDRIRYEPPGAGSADDFYVLAAPDWVNVVPLTDDGHFVMVRQFRVGVEAETLEIPGGMCDGDEDPARAAARELREETGYEAREIISIGSVHPNPALQGNRCHTFLALGVRKVGPPQPDPHESFDVLRVPAGEIGAKITGGEITHSLVISAFHLYQLNRERSRD